MAPRKKGKARGMRGYSFIDRDVFWEVKLPGAMRDWQIKCVCGGKRDTCNNGWMREKIEDPARPILEKLFKGEAIRLTPKDQLLVATWAALKAMVSEFDDGDHVTTHYMQRKRMMLRHIPPKKCWGVWIGNYERKKWLSEWISVPLFGSPDPVKAAEYDKHPSRFNGHSSTQVIGKLFIQIIRLPIPGFVNKLRFSMPEGGVLFRIWPPSTFSINWPSNAMSDLEADLTSSAMKRRGLKAARARAAEGGDYSPPS